MRGNSYKMADSESTYPIKCTTKRCSKSKNLSITFSTISIMISKKKVLVPWSDEDEWKTVRDQIISSNIKDVIRGYETLLMWKLRHPALPAYVESTLCLLQIVIKRYSIENSNYISLTMSDELDMRLTCSIALIRFVNHIYSVTASKGETLYSSAKTQNIPDWIVNLRHEAAHSHDLPTLDALFIALDISLQWLIVNYWEKKFTPISSAQNKEIILSTEESGLALQKAFDVWDCLASNKTTLGEMKPHFITYLKDFLELKNKYLGNINLEKECDIQYFVNSYNNHKSSEDDSIQDNVKTMKVGELKAILQNFFQAVMKIKSLKQAFLSAFLNSSFITNDSLKISKWQKLFEIIQCGKILEVLVKELFVMAGKGNKKASKWLLTLYPSFKLLRKKWTMFKILKKEKSNVNLSKIKRHINTLHIPKISESMIIFHISKPPIFTLDMMTCALLNPETPYLKGLTKYLTLIKPSLPPSTAKLIKNLVNIQVINDNYLSTTVDSCILSVEKNQSEKIFTIDDVRVSLINGCDASHAKIDSDGNGWRKSQIDTQVWSKCPLGLLPFQSKVNCHIPEEVDWSVEIVKSDKTVVKKKLNDWLSETNIYRFIS